MKHAILAVISCCAIAGVATEAAAQSQKKAATPATKTAPVAVAKKSPSSPAKPTTSKPAATKPSVTAAKPGTRYTANRRYYARQPVRRVYTPQQPSADRYREIQDALATRGYLKTPSTGVWDKNSMDAMQKFQQDQQLEATGKLTARSLGALGLGPRTPVASSTPPANAPGGANPAGDAPQQ